jgi:hypothetical protein
VAKKPIHVRVRFVNEWTSEHDDRQWTVEGIVVSSDGVLALDFPDGQTRVFSPRHRWVMTYPNPIETESSHA